MGPGVTPGVRGTSRSRRPVVAVWRHGPGRVAALGWRRSRVAARLSRGATGPRVWPRVAGLLGRHPRVARHSGLLAGLCRGPLLSVARVSRPGVARVGPAVSWVTSGTLRVARGALGTPLTGPPVVAVVGRAVAVGRHLLGRTPWFARRSRGRSSRRPRGPAAIHLVGRAHVGRATRVGPGRGCPLSRGSRLGRGRRGSRGIVCLCSLHSWVSKLGLAVAWGSGGHWLTG